MNDVTRYAVIETALCIGGSVLEGEVEVVRAVDFDAVTAALRAELGGWIHLVGEVCATIPLAQTLGGTESQQSMVEYFKGLHAERDNLQKRLTAAEQRNAELMTLLSEAFEAGDFDVFGIDLAERLSAALKLTESGASE